jgi:putative ABC transport system substrate-binding protein
VSFAQQQPDSRARIGFLPIGSQSNSYDRSLVDAFRQGLREVGLIENRDITVDVVWISNESEYTKAVSELVQRGVKVLITAGTSASVAAKRGSSTIPIVFTDRR